MLNCGTKKDRFLAKILLGDKAVHDPVSAFAMIVLSYVSGMLLSLGVWYQSS